MDPNQPTDKPVTDKPATDTPVGTGTDTTVPVPPVTTPGGTGDTGDTTIKEPPKTETPEPVGTGTDTPTPTPTSSPVTTPPGKDEPASGTSGGPTSV